MAKLTYKVPSEFDGYRVDTFLRAFGNVSGSTLRKAKQIPLGITQDGEHIRTIDFVRVGSIIEIDTVEKVPAYLKSDDIVEVVFENEDIIVFNKPHNMPIHPSKGNLTNTLLNAFANHETTKELTFRAMNRLDKDTSGIAFIAKNAHVASTFPQKIEKFYLALAHGVFKEKSGTVNLPIMRDQPDSMRRACREGGKHAITHFNVIAQYENFAAVLLKLETGRTHQIRVHLSHIGHPLLGDTLYDGNTSLINRHALHCAFGSVNNISVIAPIPTDFTPLLGDEFSLKVSIDRSQWGAAPNPAKQ